MARNNPWLGLGLDAWSLGMESSAVIGLRLMKIAAGGPAAQAEASLMVSEKIESAMAMQVRAMTGGLGVTPADAAAHTLKHYRRKVRANRRRLSR